MKWKKWIPDRKVMAGGLTGLVAFLAAVVLNAAGVPIDYDVLFPLVVAAGPLVSYLVPAAAIDVARHLNDEIVELAVLMPESSATAEGVRQVAEKVLAPFPAGSAR